MQEKLKKFCDKITKEGQEYLRKQNLACECNLQQAVAHYHVGEKYTRVDIGTSGRYMVDEHGNIFGIKAYGVIHKGYYYGTLDTIEEFFWGDYKAKKI